MKSRPSSSKTANKATSGKFSKWLVYAPIALELISLIRRNQKAKRGKYTKLRKRDRALDFLLGQAERRLGGKPKARRRWF
ncbi:hypothetical protein E5F05_19665 [Deinococcus metallilatus]|uniref:Uncharacterized protein n=1 Tax=Deinococcus metallilatus TaxID=1211322 RepID=A0AAJ5F228_9DEIO|nr:hypothetical protein [Deinococcus metallilatus]MBB5296359.1 hypothetical protein [Deinococcus metallilatus]QBY09963.1 hypothetical protein E5F05_19665 [Deinococcus metallilatus]RXJ08687.1 hypothetical protein ERJ73_18505 [Deinococcus metallilatus]TLK25161.1 hypothetical protein FCS05_13420 [Deinococcus metallilatus]GMA14727.1 hypothetical protein GCM10025871_10580 [Deinococcus metallilatus]